jgi:acetyl esterase/lipase
VFNQSGYKKAYAGKAFAGIRDWVKRIDLDSGVSGWWIAKPDTRRADDDVVVLYAHGGGFVSVREVLPSGTEMALT